MEYNPFSLNGKTILVTGASSGIGRSCAVECARLGAKVVLTARNSERLEETLAAIKGYAPENQSECVVADLTSEDDIVALVERMPQVNGIVHNAGVNRRVPCKALKGEDLDYILKPNLYGPVLLQKHILKRKKLLKEGSVVFIASRAPYSPNIGNAAYAASKGAILAYAKGLGMELAPQKIRVNSILPAEVLTPLVYKTLEVFGADYRELEKKYPLQRYGQPEDVAYLAVYLLSDASSWMTGSAIDLTGGG